MQISILQIVYVEFWDDQTDLTNFISVNVKINFT